MTLIPNLLARGVAAAIFSLAIVMVAVHTLLTRHAAERSTLAPRTRIVMPLIVGAFLSAWLGLAIATGDGANFPLADNQSRLILSLAVGFGPMFFAVTLLFASRSLRALNEATPSAWLIWAQTYRMAGLMFLYPFLYYRVVPAGFAVPAAVGDFVTGLLAIPVARAVERGGSNSLRWAVVWNVLGLLDLIVAPAAAVLSRAQVAYIYPLALVPLFVGPPLGILTHICSLRNLSAAARAANSGSSMSPSQTRRASRDQSYAIGAA